jgi:tetratricopeptide (TPR) repeat protein
MVIRIPLFRVVFALGVALALATSAFAQAGLVKGTVTDAAGAPVDGASIEFAGPDGVSKKTNSDKKGEFVMIGLKSGAWKVTAKKEKMEQTLMANVRQGGSSNLAFRIAPAAGGGVDNKKFQALQAAFAAAGTAAEAGDHDGAIAKYNEAIGIMPDCKDCYTNIGYEHNAKREYDKAIAAFGKALEMDKEHADAAVGLGVAYFNTQKFAEAKAQFEVATRVNPKHGFAQYQLGMTALNLGAMPDAVKALEAYLEAEPNGDKAAEVKATLPAIKGMIK